MEPRKHIGQLQKDPLFVSTLVIGLVSALVFLALGWIANPEKCCCGTSSCIAAFLDRVEAAGAIPFKILSGTLAVLGLIGLTHRSKETQTQISIAEEQISLTEKRNYTSQYLDFQSSFVDVIDEYLTRENAPKIENKYSVFRVFYNGIYKNNKHDTYTLEKLLDGFYESVEWANLVYEMEDDCIDGPDWGAYSKLLFSIVSSLHDIGINSDEILRENLMERTFLGELPFPSRGHIPLKVEEYEKIEIIVSNSIGLIKEILDFFGDPEYNLDFMDTADVKTAVRFWRVAV